MAVLTVSRALRAIPVATELFGPPGAQKATTAAVANKEPVPDIMVTFGNPPNHMTFLSHPGVMAISKLLEMKYLVSPRAQLVQENVEEIRDFDPELANKCQLAVDAGIDISFLDLDYIDRPEFLQKLLVERDQLDNAAREVLNSPPGSYRIPYYALQWEKPTAPRKWRPETSITQEMLQSDPDLAKDIELQRIVTEYLKKKPIDHQTYEEELGDPIVAAARFNRDDNKANVDSVS